MAISEEEGFGRIKTLWRKFTNSRIIKWLLRQRKKISLLLFSSVFLFILVILRNGHEVLWREGGASIDSLRVNIAVSSVLTILGVLGINIWAIRIANLLGRKKSKDLKGKCRYCGHSTSRLICSACDSIMWYRIEEKTFDFHRFAIFFAHRRWRASSAILGLFLIGPVAISYEMILSKKEESKTYEIDAKEVVLAATAWRSNLHELYLLANDPDPKRFNSKISNFLDSYYKFGWLAPRVIVYFGEKNSSCDKLATSVMKDIGQGVQSNIDSMFAHRVNSLVNNTTGDEINGLEKECISALLLESKIFTDRDNKEQTIVDFLDIEFFWFSECLRQHGQSSFQDSTCRMVANNLFVIGKIVGCILDDIAFNPQIENESTLQDNFECLTTLKDFLKGKSSKSPFTYPKSDLLPFRPIDSSISSPHIDHRLPNR